MTEPLPRSEPTPRRPGALHRARSPPSSARSSRRTTVPSWSSRAPGRGRRASSWSASAGSWRRRATPRRPATPSPRNRAPRHGNPFDGPLVPEQLLVLTYNVKAATELGQRLDAVVGPATRARMTVSNFHSFCQHILTESRSADAGLPGAPGRPRRRRPAAPPARDHAHPGPALPRGLGPGRLRRASSTAPRTSWSAPTTSTPSWTPNATESTKPDYGSFDAADRAPGPHGPPRAACARSAATTPGSAPRSAPRTPASFAVKRYRHDEHERTAEREARRNIIGDGRPGEPQPPRTRTSSRASTSSPRPT